MVPLHDLAFLYASAWFRVQPLRGGIPGGISPEGAKLPCNPATIHGPYDEQNKKNRALSRNFDALSVNAAERKSHFGSQVRVSNGVSQLVHLRRRSDATDGFEGRACDPLTPLGIPGNDGAWLACYAMTLRPDPAPFAVGLRDAALTSGFWEEGGGAGDRPSRSALAQPDIAAIP